MPLYYFQCKDCKAADRRILEPEQVKDVACRQCGGKVRRTPKPPTSILKEKVDNGHMPRTLENYVDGQQLTLERSQMDFTKPDWQKQNE
jgi:putative FmdB family regulatory protein